MANPLFVDEWLQGKTPADFDVIEHLTDRRLLWPVKLQRLRAAPDGKPGAKAAWSEEPAYLQTLDGLGLMDATDRAAQLFDERGFKISDERYQPIWHEIEMHSRVALALRRGVPQSDKPGAAYAQQHTLMELLQHKVTGISRAEVSRLDELLAVFGKFEEGKLEQVDKETAVKVALAIAEVRNLTPLAAIGGSGVDTSIVYICDLLSSYLQGKSSPPSQASSKPARSRAQS